MTRHRLVISAAIVAALVGLSFAGGCAHRQGWESISDGARVSVKVSDSLMPAGLTRKNAIVGIVTSREPESLRLQITSSDTLRLPRATITRLAVSQGQSRRRSAIRTGLFEAAIFTVLPSHRGEYFGSDHLREIAFGASFGALIGAIWPLEDWRRVQP